MPLDEINPQKPLRALMNDSGLIASQLKTVSSMLFDESDEGSIEHQERISFLVDVIDRLARDLSEATEAMISHIE